MENKEKYEKPIIEIINLLDVDIITESPIEDIENDPILGNSAPDSGKNGGVSMMAPWLSGENEDSEQDNENVQENQSEESNDNPSSNESSSLTEALHELINDIIPSENSGEDSYESNQNEEVYEEETPSGGQNEEGSGW